VELYLNVKIRSADEIKCLDEDQLDVERGKLKNVDSIVILDFVKQSVEILMEMRKGEFEDYQRNHETKKRIEKNIEKRRIEEEKKISPEKFQEPKPPKLVSVKNSRFRTKLKQLADQMETPRTSVEDNHAAEQYEKQLQKLEDDIRRHIRIEQ
jgi:hypothetical protein